MISMRMRSSSNGEIAKRASSRRFRSATTTSNVSVRSHTHASCLLRDYRSYSQSVSSSNGEVAKRASSRRFRSATTTSNMSVGSHTHVPWLLRDYRSYSQSISSYQLTHEHFQDNTVEKETECKANTTHKDLWRRIVEWKQTAEPMEAWLILFFAVMPINILTAMDNITIGIFYVEYVQYFEISNSAVSIISTMKSATTSITGLLSSTLLRLYGPKRVCMLGGLVYFVGLLTSSFASNIYMLYVSQGLLIGFAQSFCDIPCMVTVLQYFKKNAGLGCGLNMLGFTMGQLIGPTLVTYFIQIYSWRGALMLMSAILAHIMVFGMRLKPKKPNANVADVVIHSEHDEVDILSIQVESNLELSKKSIQNTTTRDHFALNELSNESDASQNNSEQNSDSNDKQPVTTLPNDASTTSSSEVTSSSQREMLHNNYTFEHQMINKGKKIIDGDKNPDDLTESTGNKDCCAEEQRPSVLASIKVILVDIFDLSLIKQYRFVLVCLASMLARYNIIIFMQFMPSKTVSLGYSKEQAALVMSICSLAALGSRVSVAIISNIPAVNRRLMYACGFLIGGLGTMLTFIHTFTGLVTMSLIMGLSLGMTNTIYAMVMVDLLGIEVFPKALALFSLFCNFASVIATPVAGHLYDVTNNYDVPFLSASVAGLSGGALMMVLLVIMKLEQMRSQKTSQSATSDFQSIDEITS